MNIFEITIQHRLEKGWPVVAEYTRPGELPRRSEGLLTLPEDYDIQLRMLQLDAHSYGTLLGTALFQGTVRDTFTAARAQAEDNEKPLRILLVVEAPDLKPLRWERLCALDSSGSWDFLTLDQNTPFSLYLPSLTDRRFPAIGRRNLRALVLLADPPQDNTYNLAPFDAETTAASVGKALGDIPFDLLGPVKNAVGPADKETLYRQITEQHYTLLHLTAHGLYRNDGETTLYLLDNEHRVAPLPASELIRDLKRLRSTQGLPHLAFLCTCESAKPEAEAALGGLAQQLVRDLGLPAVVAMTDPVSIATAEELAAAFYNRLHKHGNPDQALTEACAGMMNRPDILVPALYSRLGGRSLFSDNLDRPLTDAEIEYGLERCAVVLAEQAPVLLDELTEYTGILKETLGTDPKALSKERREERDKALTQVNGLCLEALEISFPAVALGQNIPTYDPVCPFPGLKAFQTDEQQFFFGRDTKTEELIKRLKETSFLAVLGASGSGKSSLVLAGIIPALKKEKDSLQIRYLTPGTEPQTALARQRNGLVPNQPVLLVVDQFEELFTLCADIEKRKAFLADLLKIREEHPEIYLVLTMRADFWGDCAPYPAFKELMQAHQELLAPMTTAELRTAMEQQASSVQLRFEGGLSHTILSEVENEPGAMPLLQHLLLELWKRRHGRWLLSLEYEKLGGIKEAIGGTAEAIYDELRGDNEGVALLRNIFIRLTRLGEDAEEGELYRDTRQRVNLRDLVPTDTDQEQVRSLVNLLADARLLVKGTDSETGETNVEVAHEALIRHWTRLRNWLDEDRESLILLASVRQQAADWKKNNKKNNELPRWGERLQHTEILFRQDQFAQSALEQEFLQQAKKVTKKEQRLRAGSLLLVIVLLISGIIFSVNYARVQQHNAQEQERLTMEANYNLGKAFEEKAHIALKAARGGKDIREYKKEILFVSAALEQRINPQQSALDQKSRSELFAPEVFQGALTEQWVSPYGGTHQEAVFGVTFSPDGKTLASASEDRTLRLWDIKSGNELATFKGHTDAVWNVAFSPDGKKISSASADKTVRLWDIESGRELAVFKRHIDAVTSMSLSSDGTRLASASTDKIVRLWDIENEKEIAVFKGHTGTIIGVSFSPDGTRLASTSDDQTVRLWDIESNKELAIFKGHTGAVIGVSFNPDGTRLASTSDDQTVRLWDIESNKEIAIFKGHTGAVIDVSFNLDGTRLASTSGDQTIRLWDTESSKEIAVLKGHTATVIGVSFSPDGTRLASASHDNTVRLWDVASGKEVTSIKGHTRSVNRIAFSSDGKMLVSTSDDQTIQLWNIKNGKNIKILKGHNDSVRSVNFSPSNSLLASTSDDHTVRLWNITSGEELTVFKGHTNAVWDVAFSPNGKKLASASWDNSVRLWDIASGKEVAEFKGHTHYVWSVAFSPDGKILASTSNDKTVRLWDVASGKEIARFNDHTGSVFDVAFSHDGTRLASASIVDRTIRLWDISSGKKITEFEGHIDAVWGVAFSPDDKKIASTSDDQTVRLWDVASGEELIVLKGHTDTVWSVAFSPDGKKLASSSQDRTIRLWDIESGEKGIFFKGHSNTVSSASFSPDGSRLASTSWDKTVRLWDVASSEELIVFKGHTDHVANVTFSPDGKKLASASRDKTVRLWDIESGNELKQMKGHEKWVNSVVFSPDGKMLASASDDQTVRLWDTTSGNELAKIKGHTRNVWSVAFSPDGKQLASASRDMTIRLWDIESGQELKRLEGHKDWIRSVIFSPDGTQLASASRDMTIRLWDVKSGRELKQLEGHKKWVRSVTFSPDGTRLASASADSTVRVWDIKSGKELIVFKNDNDSVYSVSFSPDGTKLVSTFGDGTMRIWDNWIQILFLKGDQSTPLYHNFMAGVKFLWQVQDDGFELMSGYRKHTLYAQNGYNFIHDNKFHPLLSPPPSGKSKFDQVLQWAKTQEKKK